jgi:ribosome biogenesis protein SSF1/2
MNKQKEKNVSQKNEEKEPTLKDSKKTKNKKILKKKLLKQKNEEIQLKEIENVPRSIVYCKSNVGKDLKELKNSFVNIMRPYTAVNIKIGDKDNFKDIVKFATEMVVSHLISFSITNVGAYMHLHKLPSGFEFFLIIGPTLLFRYYNINIRLVDYCSISDVNKYNMKVYKKNMFSNIKFPFRVILNNFNGQKNHIKLAGSSLQNMFPPISAENVFFF